MLNKSKRSEKNHWRRMGYVLGEWPGYEWEVNEVRKSKVIPEAGRGVGERRRKRRRKLGNIYNEASWR